MVIGVDGDCYVDDGDNDDIVEIEVHICVRTGFQKK